ncbi:hypothetical protein DLV22_22800 [Shigella boydii]|uniref:Uncharacterized protein n=1 Tax=Shigella boydii TaxID=621 RepID=A0A8H9E1L1_SHIBO|nr:hypothetical protein [Escherichia coli]EGE3747439.1 hypothetical protein [Shigella boydii]EIT4383349.1 hypothetical protein [Escherichia coli]
MLRLTTPFESGLVRLINFANEAAAMVATPTQTHPKYQYRFMALDPENTDLAHELIAWALKTAAHASAAQRNTPEVDNA